jgi:hypothetical protein
MEEEGVMQRASLRGLRGTSTPPRTDASSTLRDLPVSEASHNGEDEDYASTVDQNGLSIPVLAER